MGGTREGGEGGEEWGIGRGEEYLSRLCKVVWRTKQYLRNTRVVERDEKIHFRRKIASLDQSERGCECSLPFLLL
jgi:hypothetical protein